MTQGEIEQVSKKIEKIFSDLEIRIMSDIVRRIQINGFSTASADWQMTRLQQLGWAESEIKEYIKEALGASDAEIQDIFSNQVYKQYMGHKRAYKVSGFKQIPFEKNRELQRLLRAAKEQIAGEYQNLTGSMGFALRDAAGKIQYTPLLDFYRTTLDSSVIDIQSGAFSYQQVLERTIHQMTASGLRWIDYDSGVHNRVDVAARRAVLTGFRQVQGKINEQVAEELGTDSYEVSWHVGARPTHQVWQGRVYTMEELRSICGLGTVEGLHGANCYHDYNPFIPGISVRTYTDEWLDAQNAAENTPKSYLGKDYTTYEALQHQRHLEATMRKYRQDIKLLQTAGGTEDSIIAKKARYQGKMQEYEAFSKAMRLPMQKERIYQDGLGGIKIRKNTPKWKAIIREPLKKFSVDELNEMTQETGEIVKKHISVPSKWSGRVVIDPPDGRYGKLWNCDISTMSETAPHILLHEQIHACSISNFDVETYINNWKIEEATVQLATQEICAKEGMQNIKSQYDEMVTCLREVNRRLELFDSDYDFAVKLVGIPVAERIDWMREQMLDIMFKKGTLQDIQEIDELLDALQ